MGNIRRWERMVEKSCGVKKKRRTDAGTLRVRNRKKRETEDLQGKHGLGAALMTLLSMAFKRRQPFYRKVAQRS